MKEALDRLDTPAELFVAPGEIHAFDAMVWRAPARAKWKATHAFLSKHMQPTLQGSATNGRVSA